MLNGHQMKILGNLRETRDKEAVYATVKLVKPEAYASDTFRELLFALDAENCLNEQRWSDLMSQGLLSHSDWINDGKLDPKAFIEMGTYHETYGRGETSLRVIIDLFEFSTARPANATSFSRRTVREYFNGIQPITERGVFLLKRYAEVMKPLTADDVLLFMRISDVTKGLENHITFDHFYGETIVDAMLVNDDWNESSVHQVISQLMKLEEYSKAEVELIETMRSEGLELPKRLLDTLDLRIDKVSGIA